MKTFFFIFLFFTAMQVTAQVPPAVPSASEILQPAYAKAAAENKNVLLIFSASWCGWCRKMEASLDDPAVKPLIDKWYKTAHLTVYEAQNKKSLENTGALELLTKWGGADKGLPYWFVLDKGGAVLRSAESQPGVNTGCPATENEVAYFISVLQKTSGLTEDELETIQKRFRKNEE